MNFAVFLTSMNMVVAQSDSSHTFSNHKSAEKALWLSMGPTVGASWIGGALYSQPESLPKSVKGPGFGLLMTGLVIAPSFGHFYAKNYRRAIGHIFLRGFAAGAFGFTQKVVISDHASDLSNGVWLLLSGGFLIYDAIKESVKAQESARRYNDTLALLPTFDLQGRSIKLNVVWLLK